MQESTLSYQCWRERESNVEHGMRFAKDAHCIIQCCRRPVTSTDKKLLTESLPNPPPERIPLLSEKKIFMHRKK